MIEGRVFSCNLNSFLFRPVRCQTRQLHLSNLDGVFQLTSLARSLNSEFSCYQDFLCRTKRPLGEKVSLVVGHGICIHGVQVWEMLKVTFNLEFISTVVWWVVTRNSLLYMCVYMIQCPAARPPRGMVFPLWTYGWVGCSWWGVAGVY